MMWKRFFSAVLLCAAASWLHAQAAPQTTVTLISENSAAAPGSQVSVGIQFQLEPGWHIYWMNPGDAGQAPSVQWALPAGWTASALDWPAPFRLTNAAGVDYGYEGQVTLLTKLKVPATAKPGPANLRADVKWLVCKEQCIPQKTQAQLNLNVAAKSAVDLDAKSQFTAVRSKLPKALPADWKANVLSNPRQLLLNFMPGAKVEQAVFFPAEPQVIENAAQQKLSSTSVRAQLALDRVKGVKKPAALKGVMVLNGAEAYNVNLPIK